MSEQDIATIMSRLDRLEATWTERHANDKADQRRMTTQIIDLDERMRQVEITQARILVLVFGGSTLGGIIGGAAMQISKLIGAH